MENASKALLIAGTVLIVILFIAAGMRLFNSADRTTDSVGTSIQTKEAQTFNSQFMPYIGKNKTATETKTLFNLITVNNATNKEHLIMIHDNYNVKKDRVFDEEKYDIIIVSYDKQGFIDKIAISGRFKTSLYNEIGGSTNLIYQGEF